VTGVWVGFDKPRTIIANGFAGELAVPMWARFMKQATASDKPDPFKAPQGLVTVGVCRLSGRLPNAACDRVVSEYFARGSVPTEVCQEHSFFTASAQLVSAYPGGAVIASNAGSAAYTPQPPAHTRDAPVIVASQGPSDIVMAPEKEEQPKKKRGFWGRLFGRGDKEKAQEGNNLNQR
jgi:penicillin-binding protein 1A